MPKRYRQHQNCSHSVASMANATDQLNRSLGVLRLRVIETAAAPALIPAAGRSS